MAPEAYRAPLRSRRDDIDAAQTFRRALSLGLCGFGGVLRPAPADLAAALRLAAEQYDERTSARIARFAAVADGALVWTRAADGMFWLGRIEGPWRYDKTAAAAAVDLVHVRRCGWAPRPFLERHTPAAVVATFRRGGKNFQRIRAESAGPESERCWQRH
ncbi:GAF domain-containing protein [[Mycobacterium] burgundiense]|uniref:GAF domain-containing protein n=1 Tax=[Mycobacterium] burgundiense TaxID=3064286 RepID=A0ABM9M1L0_9MYCO|nr:GAF domain-containing protein [Mycolicibacterium sp. MU0053]CAJ1508622.1 GAF domain-containing protein [Mycolicibacterium sp. MU0053]